MVVVVAFSSRARIKGRMFDNSFPACGNWVLNVTIPVYIKDDDIFVDPGRYVLIVCSTNYPRLDLSVSKLIHHKLSSKH